MRKIIGCIAILAMLNFTNTIFAMEELEVGDPKPCYSKEAYTELFETNGITVPEDAIFDTCVGESEDGETLYFAKMSVESDSGITDSLLMEYEITDTGTEKLLSIETSMNDLYQDPEVASVNNSQTKTKYSVTITAEYNKRYQSSTGYYEYQPKKVSMVSSSTQNARVVYYIYGWITGTNTHGGHSITVAEYPAYQGQLYSKTNTASTYYQPIVRFHKLMVTVGNYSTVDIYLNGPDGVDDY